ncbi:MAG: symmetrical bis(5'-nucleosyl)-tetraphosphatase [Legionellaceae bacterium]|nr:symmetrical bis(5'-nucleosyl)-tetraphosphatase [Legionellaceae bacterium]
MAGDSAARPGKQPSAAYERQADLMIYVIGDIQGCYEPLMRLLDTIEFSDTCDQLWLLGDVVNRGPDSLAVLRFLKNLAQPPLITLGNHDLHFLGRLFTADGWTGADDTLDALLAAGDAHDLGHWLRQQKIMHYDAQEKIVMSHAGIAPCWDLPRAMAYARELENALRADDFRDFLQAMYGNEPAVWQDDLQGMDRLRVICNYYTRMRFCDAKGALLLDYKGGLAEAPAGFYPWFSVPSRQPIAADILFGHWAALQGHCPVPGIHALDTGCVWGGTLTALRLSDRQRFSVS